MPISARSWSADGRGFYWGPIITGVTADPSLHYFDMIQQHDREVFSVPPKVPGQTNYSLTPSPDGKAFAYQAATEAKTLLMEVTLERP